MDYKSIRSIIDADRNALMNLALRVACEYPEEFRKCAILNGLVDDLELIVTWDNEKVEIKSSVMNQLREYAKADRKVDAVKLLRNETGMGLKCALETIKMLFPEFRDHYTPIVTTPPPGTTFFDRRPTDPGHVDERDRPFVYHGSEDDDEFVNWKPTPLPEGFNDDQPRGVSLGELLRDHIANTEQPQNPDPVDWSRFRPG